MFESVSTFLHYWYFRYLMVTELYMVEKWERAVINVFFIVLLSVLSYFNSTMALKLTTVLLNSVSSVVRLMPADVFPNLAVYSDVSLWGSS